MAERLREMGRLWSLQTDEEKRKWHELAAKTERPMLDKLSPEQKKLFIRQQMAKIESIVSLLVTVCSFNFAIFTVKTLQLRMFGAKMDEGEPSNPCEHGKMDVKR